MTQASEQQASPTEFCVRYGAETAHLIALDANGKQLGKITLGRDAGPLFVILAAAPKMLTALTEIENVLCHLGSDCDPDHLAGIARAAIAKARGEV